MKRLTGAVRAVIALTVSTLPNRDESGRAVRGNARHVARRLQRGIRDEPAPAHTPQALRRIGERTSAPTKVSHPTPLNAWRLLPEHPPQPALPPPTSRQTENMIFRKPWS